MLANAGIENKSLAINETTMKAKIVSVNIFFILILPQLSHAELVSASINYLRDPEINSGWQITAKQLRK